MPDLFPAEEWLPKTEASTLKFYVSEVPGDVAVRAARYFAENPALANDAVVEFIDQRLSGDTRGEVVTQLYEQADAALRTNSTEGVFVMTINRIVHGEVRTPGSPKQK